MSDLDTVIVNIYTDAMHVIAHSVPHLVHQNTRKHSNFLNMLATTGGYKDAYAVADLIDYHASAADK